MTKQWSPRAVRRLWLAALAAALIASVLWAGSPAGAVFGIAVSQSTGLLHGDVIEVTLTDVEPSLSAVDLAQCEIGATLLEQCNLAQTQTSMAVEFGSGVGSFTVKELEANPACNAANPCALFAIQDSSNFVASSVSLTLNFAPSVTTTTTTSSTTTTTLPPTSTTSSTTTTTLPPTSTTSSTTTTTLPPTSTTSSTTTTTTVPNPNLRRLLALGDSIPYGHGLANPGAISQPLGPGLLPPGQGPAPGSYPALVAEDSGFSAFRLRPTACGLGPGSGQPPFDHLGFSGASAHERQGYDLNCTNGGGEPIRQRTVWPDQLDAAALRTARPAMVTLQAGAGDIRLGACLAAILRLPDLPSSSVSPLLGPTRRTCVEQRGRNFDITRRVDRELDDLQDDLERIIRKLKDNGPDPKIALLNYYQPVPHLRSTVSGASPACVALRFPFSTHRDRMWDAAQELVGELNKRIEKVAKSAKVNLVDIRSVFRGHELCTSDSWLFDSPWAAGHPTERGQCAIAAAVEKKLKLPVRDCD